MKSEKTGNLYIGTSNVVMPGNRVTFPPDFQTKSRLCYYSTLLNSVEINSSFKKIPMPSTVAKWAAETTEDFRFTLKLHKEITHIKKLEIDPNIIDLFLEAAITAGEKKGCLLVQFPGSITLDYYSKVEEILSRLYEGNEGRWNIAVEFRHESWYHGEGFELLDEFEASMVLHDMKKVKNELLNKSARFVYIRFHGPKGDYRGDYDNETLLQNAKRILRFMAEGKDTYVYFNNTMGNAFDNAIKLKEMVARIFKA